ncbi:MAG: methyltransferase domain-containing protein [Pseudomonadota bacterium]
MSLALADPASAPDEAASRRMMIDTQLRTNGVNDPALLAAIASVSRAAFVPAGAVALAYADRAVPLTRARALNPSLTTARLIGDAQVATGQNILLIGAGAGYAAAVLSALGARVTAVENDPALLAMARTALSGSAHVTLVDAPLTAGAPDGAPYDALIIDGAVESVPASLVSQLADGARIAAGIFDAGVTRLVRAVKMAGSDVVQPHAYADLECVRLPGFSPPPTFTF